MKATIATLFGLVVLATATPAAAHTAHQRPCPPRNPHCRPVKPPQPPPSCVWVVGGAVGDSPRCV